MHIKLPRIKKPTEGAVGKDHFKKVEREKNKVDYMARNSAALAFLQLLTVLRGLDTTICIRQARTGDAMRVCAAATPGGRFRFILDRRYLMYRQRQGVPL